MGNKKIYVHVDDWQYSDYDLTLAEIIADLTDVFTKIPSEYHEATMIEFSADSDEDLIDVTFYYTRDETAPEQTLRIKRETIAEKNAAIALENKDRVDYQRLYVKFKGGDPDDLIDE